MTDTERMDFLERLLYSDRVGIGIAFHGLFDVRGARAVAMYDFREDCHLLIELTDPDADRHPATMREAIDYVAGKED